MGSMRVKQILQKIRGFRLIVAPICGFARWWSFDSGYQTYGGFHNPGFFLFQHRSQKGSPVTCLRKVSLAVSISLPHCSQGSYGLMPREYHGG